MTTDEKERIIALGMAGGLTREYAEQTFDSVAAKINAHFEFERKWVVRAQMGEEIRRVMTAEIEREREKEKKREKEKEGEK